MSQCPQCGSPSSVGQAFCGTCGANLANAEVEQTVVRTTVPLAEPALAPGQPTAQFLVQPPSQPPGYPPQGGNQPQYAAAPSRPAHANIDLTVLLKGNWLGAALTAGAALAIALLFSALIAFGAAEDLDINSAIGLTAVLVCATFGANELNDDGGGTSTSLGQYPLLATVLALGAAAYAFRRAAAGYPTVRSAMGDALRASLILSAMLTLLAVVVRIVEPDLSGYEGSSSNDTTTSDLASTMGNFGLGINDGPTVTSIAGAIFLGFLLLLVVLVFACLLRSDWLDSNLVKVYEWLAAPLAGLAVLVVSLFAAGLVYVIAIMIGEDSSRNLSQVVGLVAVLPSLGMRLLGLGAGAEFGIKFKTDDGDEESMDRLPDFADDHGALFWIAPLITIAIALAGVYTVIRRSADRSKVQRNVLVYLGLLLISVPLLVRLANFHGDGEVTVGRNTSEFSLFGGIDGFQSTMSFFLISLLAAIVMLVVTGNNLDVAKLRSKAASFAQTVQANPGQPGQSGQPQLRHAQPTQQQWGGPPPGPPPQGPPPGQAPPEGWSPPPPPQQ